MPKSELEKRRFSYFYNDRLTGLYNEDYLKIRLQNNRENRNDSCLNIIHLNNLPAYNKREGWDKGNVLFAQFADELQFHYPESMVFRVYGNYFALVTREHVKISSRMLNAFPRIKNVEITAEVHHVDLDCTKTYTFVKDERLKILSSR